MHSQPGAGKSSLSPADGSEITRRSFLTLAAAGAAGTLLSSHANAATGAPAVADPSFLTLQEAADQIRRKRLSPVALTQACLQRIDRLNPALNAFITVTAEAALASARDAEREVQAGRYRGPLHGIPIALKDLYDTAGVRTTAGSGVFQNRVPTEDAEVVRRLKAAGAVIVGKTNMHEFAYGATSAVSHFGAVKNPWAHDRIAGGSSGGSAAAVAAGMCFAAMGSDTGASIRQPAAYCGIVGHKPTYGLVSCRGVIPLSWSFDHAGPITRTVADSAVVLQVIAGYDPLDLASQPMPVPDYVAALKEKVSPLRVGVARSFFFSEVESEVETAVNEAITELKRLTADVRDIELTARNQEALRAAVRLAEAHAYHAPYLEQTPQLYQPETLQRLRAGAEVKADSYIAGRREVELTRRTGGAAFRDVDVIITPTTPIAPPLLADVNKDIASSIAIGSRSLRNTSPFNVYGWPTVSVPCGFTSSGLPIGLQISGPLGADATVLRLAHAYEAATPWHTRRPTVA
jgi:aspartyl-tRNA(Asn)/glutamyl-tRNA(Gln) amidotransferase subunit A